MNTTEFIKKALNSIQKVFPEASIKYQYKSISDTHFIKVVPESIFSNDRFIDLDFELTDQFYALNLDGDLCFLGEDSLVELDQPSMTIFPSYAMSSLSTSVQIDGITLNMSPLFSKLNIQEPSTDLPKDIGLVGNTQYAMAA